MIFFLNFRRPIYIYATVIQFRVRISKKAQAPRQEKYYLLNKNIHNFKQHMIGNVIRSLYNKNCGLQSLYRQTERMKDTQTD